MALRSFGFGYRQQLLKVPSKEELQRSVYMEICAVMLLQWPQLAENESRRDVLTVQWIKVRFRNSEAASQSGVAERQLANKQWCLFMTDFNQDVRQTKYCGIIIEYTLLFKYSSSCIQDVPDPHVIMWAVCSDGWHLWNTCWCAHFPQLSPEIRATGTVAKQLSHQDGWGWGRAGFSKTSHLL